MNDKFDVDNWITKKTEGVPYKSYSDVRDEIMTEGVWVDENVLATRNKDAITFGKQLGAEYGNGLLVFSDDDAKLFKATYKLGGN